MPEKISIETALVEINRRMRDIQNIVDDIAGGLVEAQAAHGKALSRIRELELLKPKKDCHCEDSQT